LGLQALVSVGFQVDGEETIQVMGKPNPNSYKTEALQSFLEAVQEEQFRCQYFSEVPLETITYQTSSGMLSANTK